MKKNRFSESVTEYFFGFPYTDLNFCLSLPTDCTCKSKHVQSWHVQSVPCAPDLFVPTWKEKFNSSKIMPFCLRFTVLLKTIQSRDWYPCFPWLPPLKIKAYFVYLRQRSKMMQKGFSRVNAGNVTHGKVMKFREIFEHRSLTTEQEHWHLNGGGKLPGHPAPSWSKNSLF